MREAFWNPLDVQLEDIDRFAKEGIPTFRDIRTGGVGPGSAVGCLFGLLVRGAVPANWGPHRLDFDFAFVPAACERSRKGRDGGFFMAMRCYGHLSMMAGRERFAGRNGECLRACVGALT